MMNETKERLEVERISKNRAVDLATQYNDYISGLYKPLTRSEVNSQPSRLARALLSETVRCRLEIQDD